MYSEYEVKKLLEQAFQEGYDNGIDDTLDYIDENYELEEDSFDLEEEYDYYTESKNVKNQMDKLDSKYNDINGVRHYYASNPKSDWTKFASKKVLSKKTGDISGGSKDIHDARVLVGKTREYIVNNNDPDEYRQSAVRGRIKSAGYSKSDDPRSEKLKEKVKANADRREEEKKAKLRPFKNKGNRYDD